jgi:electron transport complex protein RnfB
MLEKLEINNTCISCDACSQNCPEGSVISNGNDYAIDSWSCTMCGICIEVCPSNSIKVINNTGPNHSK